MKKKTRFWWRFDKHSRAQATISIWFTTLLYLFLFLPLCITNLLFFFSFCYIGCQHAFYIFILVTFDTDKFESLPYILKMPAQLSNYVEIFCDILIRQSGRCKEEKKTNLKFVSLMSWLVDLWKCAWMKFQLSKCHQHYLRSYR